MKSNALNLLESAINDYLKLDSNSDSRLRQLSGKRLRLTLKPVTLNFCFSDSKVKLEEKAPESVDTILSGYPWAYLQLALSQNNDTRLFQQQLHLEGDVELGMQVKALFDEMNIDWEEHLSKITGDVLAHSIATFSRKAVKFTDDIKKSLTLNLSEYLQEEARLTPGREELNDFFDDVDALRLHLDRLTAKLEQVEHKS